MHAACAHRQLLAASTREQQEDARFVDLVEFAQRSSSSSSSDDNATPTRAIQVASEIIDESTSGSRNHFTEFHEFSRHRRDRNLQNYSGAIKIRRLKRMYRFWEPLDSISRSSTRRQPAACLVEAPPSPSPSHNNHHDEDSRRAAVGTPITCDWTRLELAAHTEEPQPQAAISANYYAAAQFPNNNPANLATADDLDLSRRPASSATIRAGEANRKLWQSLVTPIVLGCVIFLVALWTRQLSLVLLNDTLAMIFILAAVFVTMSGLAFWLAQEPKGGGDGSQVNNFQSTTPSHTCRPSSSSSALNATNCPHCSSHNQNVVGASKCCDLAVIDCEPPDYWLALLESKPIQFHDQEDNSNNNIYQQYDSSARSLILRVESPSSMHCPPSYDELTISSHEQAILR